ncbi:tRNA (adenosine(37)-N6)-threonylcarbamoyltransferase complex ATPase subunit type 1 TsaE [Mucilaginibacter arboris]|uniref:tRNA threonylcarbamoyladenosine biosynthesis protein TsaE n=1 Tax=Mucilaginibacter arboris TaxID=2682090 RepID=A0A7K1SS90_9SPHI|nr:tRNA (adenosine(37)-N6)-threonylcarbamoyltransferase complex ATPase subunit type 1 TsaE [Mucilaginibacter arboris]MVN20171.1 tRNA (adenosine(37)-N6)-threonylcarbamoyltransferase complex ATPase subunit type 1 TsaE [Mucilaginibacter arboris]
MTTFIYTEKEIENAVDFLLSRVQNQKILLFYGEMGAGKTTFIKAFCAALVVTDTVSSPTFSIVNEYEYPEGIVYHFDFYRLKNQAEALDIGVEEYFYSGNYCLIEWPEKIPDLLPENSLKILVEVQPDQQRKLTIAKI